MEQESTQNKPEGFSEHFAKRFSECVARGIVEKSIRAIHNNKNTVVTKVDRENKQSA